jgi:nucleoside-diphosphate-sugar epimerase
VKVLVTGASGFLGGCIAEALAAAGHAAFGLVRSDEQEAVVAGLGAIPRRGDLLDAASLSAALSDVEAVVHAAGCVGARVRRDELLRVNVGGLENLVGAMRARGVRRLVHLSTLRVLGMAPPPGADESAPLVASGDPYGDSKIEAERWLAAHAEAAGVAWVTLRPGYAYGPRDRHLVPALLEALGRGQVRYANRGENLWNPLFGADVARAAVAALERDLPPGAAVHLASDEPISVRRFVEALCDRTGAPRPTREAPARVVELLRASWSDGASASPIVFDLLVIDRRLDLSRARAWLSFAPSVPLDEGLARTVAWLRARRDRRASP